MSSVHGTSLLVVLLPGGKRKKAGIWAFSLMVKQPPHKRFFVGSSPAKPTKGDSSKMNQVLNVCGRIGAQQSKLPTILLQMSAV